MYPTKSTITKQSLNERELNYADGFASAKMGVDNNGLSCHRIIKFATLSLVE